jgi:hypothetical protein
VAFSGAAASPFDCASMHGAQHNIATVTAITDTKRFDISAASKFAFFKSAEEFYIKRRATPQNSVCYSCTGGS